MHAILKGSLVFQAIAIAPAFFIPFGFDHPSSLGLDFGHFLLLLITYAIALAAGIVAACAAGRFLCGLAQLVAACVAVFMAFAVGL